MALPSARGPLRPPYIFANFCPKSAILAGKVAIFDIFPIYRVVFVILTKFGGKKISEKNNIFSRKISKKNFLHPKNFENFFLSKPIMWGVKSCVLIRASEIYPLLSHKTYRKMPWPKNGSKFRVRAEILGRLGQKKYFWPSKSQICFIRICVLKS